MDFFNPHFELSQETNTRGRCQRKNCITHSLLFGEVNSQLDTAKLQSVNLPNANVQSVKDKK